MKKKPHMSYQELVLDKRGYIDDHVLCENCAGAGEYYAAVGVPDYQFGGSLIDKLFDCEVCDGKGWVLIDAEY